MSIKVSVVVPVFNGERYLHQCVQSLINQTLKEVEFIFVDDGSTDDSLKILEEFKKTDSRIQILKQKHCFAGVARNNGMRIAKGKYIIFLDSDDFFDSDMLKSCYETAEKDSIEVTLFATDFFDDKSQSITSKRINKYLLDQKHVFSSADLGDQVFSCTYGYPWDKFILRSFLEKQNIEFKATPKCNDVFWSRMVVVSAQRMTYISKILVHYRYNNYNSIQGNKNKNMFYYLQSAIDLKEELVKRGLIENVSFYRAYINEAIDAASAPLYLMNEKDKLKEYFNKMKELLIPNIFVSEKEVPSDSLIYDIIISNSFEDYLWSCLDNKGILIEKYKKNYVSIKCMEYRIGRVFTYIPKKIYKLMRSVLKRK